MPTIPPAATPERARLDAAIDAVWAAFSDWPLREIGVCVRCCLAPEDERFLRETPRDEIHAKAFRAYFGSADDAGVGAAFGYFAPRVLELLARETEPGDLHAYLPVVLRRMRAAAETPRWSAKHADAVDALARALAADLVASPEARGLTLSETALIFAIAGRDPWPIFEIIAGAPAGARARALALDVVEGPLNLWRNPLAGVVSSSAHEWPDDVDPRPLIDFVSDPARVAELERAYFTETDPAWAARISAAEERLRALLPA